HYTSQTAFNLEIIIHRLTVVMAALLLGFVLTVTFMDHAFAARSNGGYSKNEIKQMVVDEAEKNGVVPVALALAVAHVESHFQANAQSHVGARGVMQIMPATARGEFGVSADKLWNPRLNIQLGIRFLEKLYRQYGNRWELALSHYNGGTLKGRGANARPHSYTRKYVAKVTKYWRSYSRNALVIASAEKVGKLRKAETGRFGSENANRSRNSYWLLEEPTVERSWRDYLNEADRILSGDVVEEKIFDGYEYVETGVTSANADQANTSTLGDLRSRFRKSLQQTNQNLYGERSQRFM
ncbi:MAG: lytic transglycosylase domain-containing protein, partial [Alphaproteobacteria bacterium]|nr:lytic transglycosylase domain-containing protein [Alphaproteobacteria bacterium]